MHQLNSLWQQFLRERNYVHNVTISTREWSESAWKAFTSAAILTPDSAAITRADLQRFVVHLRERGVRPVSCDTRIRALDAFCRWLHEQGEAPTRMKLAPHVWRSASSACTMTRRYAPS